MGRWAVACVSKAMRLGVVALWLGAVVAGSACAHGNAQAQLAEFGRVHRVADEQGGVDAPRQRVEQLLRDHADSALRAQAERLGGPETTSPRFAAGPGWLPFWVLVSIAAGGLVAWLLARTGRQRERPAAQRGASVPTLCKPSLDGARDAAPAVTEARRR